MMLIDCPHCGPRNSAEFRYLGEKRSRPDPRDDHAAGNGAPTSTAAPTRPGGRPRTGVTPPGAGRSSSLERHTGTNEIRSSHPRPGRCRVTPAWPAAAGRGDRPSGPLAFTWNGRPHTGFAGDTIVSALAAAGERVFSRSLKYHRPARACSTASFPTRAACCRSAPEPNVRGAHRLLAAGMDVRRAERVAVAAVRREGGEPGASGGSSGRASTTRPSWRPARCGPRTRRCSSASRRAGRCPGWRRPPTTTSATPTSTCWSPAAGPPGMSAALAAAEAGARVLLVEEEHQVGGHLRWGGKAELELLVQLRAAVGGRRPASRCSSTPSSTGRYDDNWVAVVQRTVPGTHPGRRAPRSRSARRPWSSPRASSSARTCSPATTCPACCSRRPPAGCSTCGPCGRASGRSC